MGKRRPRSFATRLVVAFVGAAVGLMLLIGAASSLFTFYLYARTSNEVIASTTRTIERRIAENAARHLPLKDLAPRITADLGRPRIHIAVYADDLRLISESGPAKEPSGMTGAVASLMGLQRTRIPLSGGFIVITADLNQLQLTLRAYWTLMLPVGVLA